MTNVGQSAKDVDAPLITMKALIALIIFGWLAVVTFFGPELARAINAPEAPAHRRAR